MLNRYQKRNVPLDNNKLRNKHTASMELAPKQNLKGASMISSEKKSESEAGPLSMNVSNKVKK